MIRCENIVYSYDGKTRALDGVNLTIADGEFLCVLGGNGSGKSTLAKHLNALIVPDEGRVTVEGFDTADPEYVYDIRSRVGLVFQNPDDQLVATLVADDVAFGPENLGVAPQDIEAGVARALDAVGLGGFERRETHALSGGQKQRVAIAGVLAMKPHVIVLDEATAMLDPRGRRGLMRAARALHEQGMTVVMITHFMEEAADADRVVVLDQGKIALEGTPAEVLTHADELSRLELDVPPSCALAVALARGGIAVEPRVDEDAMVVEIARAFTGAAAQAEAPARSVAGDPAGPAAADSAGPAAAASAGEVCLALKGVSYSYETSSRERARRSRRRANARRAAWGSDPNEVWALRDVDLAVHQGEFLGIAGHTGSGKSTLIQHLNGLIHPTEGTVELFGADLAGRRAAAVAKGRAGIVFQYPEQQLFARTVFEDVAFGPRNLGMSEAEVAERVREALDSVGLAFDEVAEKSPFALSGGQQRRCAFAGVIAMRPDVLVLDEPAAGLDPAARREFLGLIARLNEQGLTVVMVSHGMDDLASLADRIVVLNEGRVALEGVPRTVFARAEELERIGLGLPAAERMARRLREAGVPVGEDVFLTVDELAGALSALKGMRS
ncbi:energy-coupling factor transporter ATPase [Collinsella sp. An307]|uniref:energy-coupling factor transporter ATPase n=1 Tax=Collinsella sp. An307 TaxID=1965630 RepID=UPI000B38B420|nr:energy-coupling factor transporter ATPase [Collinsella sp. An307]OUO21222.1 energy-coupling factor transporter ATPase [Collinsella sp. An307]